AKRTRDRAWQLRVAQAALGAAAVLVAVVLFVGLRNTAPTSNGTAGAPEHVPAASPGALASQPHYTAVTLNSYALGLATQISKSSALAAASPSFDRVAASPKGKSAQSQGLACIQKATTGLVTGARVYQFQQATYEGRPAYVGAFLTDINSQHPHLYVVAVTVSQCD